jgi:hypothetical protein
MVVRRSVTVSWRRLVVLVGSGMTIAAAAGIVGCSRQTDLKWVNR